MPSPLIREVEEGCLLGGVDEQLRACSGDLAQGREVVVLAEQIGELMCLFGQRAHHRGPPVLEQAPLVPQVLHALAPLVQARGGRGAFSLAAPLPGATVGVLQAHGQNVITVGQTHGRHRIPGLLGQAGRSDGGLGLGEDLLAGGAVLIRQHLPRAGVGARRQQVSCAGDESVECLLEDRGIARARQVPARITQQLVGVAVEGVRHPVANQLQSCASLLERLPGRVHRVVASPVGVSVQLGERGHDLLVNRSEDALPCRLGLESVRHEVSNRVGAGGDGGAAEHSRSASARSCGRPVRCRAGRACHRTFMFRCPHPLGTLHATPPMELAMPKNLDEDNPLARPLPEMLSRTAENVARTTDVSDEAAETLVDESAQRYEDASVERFVPMLVERDVRKRLQEDD